MSTVESYHLIIEPMKIKFLLAILLAVFATGGVAHAQTATTTATSTNGIDYSQGTYFYYYTNGASQVSANPSTGGTAAPQSTVGVSGTNPANPLQGTYYYYYSTDGSPALTGSNTGAGITTTTGATGAATPGLPNTGSGGEAITLIAMLLASGALALAGGVKMARTA